MKLISSALIALTCLSLAACGSSTDENEASIDGTTADQPDWNRYEENKETALAVSGAMSDTTRVDTTPTQDTASMSGTFGIETNAVFAATGSSGDIVGEMTMEADFGAGRVEGQLYNTFVNYIVTDTHDPLTGSLDYDGTVAIAADEIDSSTSGGSVPTNTDIVANGTKTLTDPDGVGYNIYLDLFGDVHEIPTGDAADPQTAVDGLLEGNITLTDSDGITDPLIYNIDGTYIVHE